MRAYSHALTANQFEFQINIKRSVWGRDWAELPPQLEEAKQFGITRNICDFILPWRMRGGAGQRGQGAGQHQSSFVLYKCNGRRWGIKCRSRLNETLFPSHAHCEMWANKKHCILFGSRRNINWIFYLKTKANFAGQPEWERAGERRSEEKRWREWERERQSASAPLSTFVILSKNENINSQRVISAATNAARRRRSEAAR